VKLFTDLKLNFCIPTASLLLLASFGAWAQAQPPCAWWDMNCMEKERQRLYMEQMNKKMQQQPPSQQNPQQPSQQGSRETNTITQLQPIQLQPITQPNQQQTTEQIASLKADLKLLTEKNQRMIESAMRYGACLTNAQGEALSQLAPWQHQHHVEMFNRYFPKAHFNMLAKSNDCHRQFSNSFK